MNISIFSKTRNLELEVQGIKYQILLLLNLLSSTRIDETQGFSHSSPTELKCTSLTVLKQCFKKYILITICCCYCLFWGHSVMMGEGKGQVELESKPCF